MIALLTAIFSALAAGFNYATKSLVGLGTRIYNDKFSPQAKQCKEVVKQTEEAIKSGDRSQITAAFDRLNRLPKAIIVVALLFVSGCWPYESKPAQIVLHPIDQIDYIELKQGQEISWTDINNVRHKGAPKDGFFLSEFYRNEVMQVKQEPKE